MDPYRQYGSPPYKVAVVHGGPGAPGMMKEIAQNLASNVGVIEPFQTATSIPRQTKELQTILEETCEFPITLIGWSWGAVLSYLFTAKHGSSIKKLIMVSAPPLLEQWAKNIQTVRLNRLSRKQKEQALLYIDQLNNASHKNKDKAMRDFGNLMAIADSFSRIPFSEDSFECSYDIFIKIWEEAVVMRKNRSLLLSGSNIFCPVIAIHGEYDPHPVKGVEDPLSNVVSDFRMIRLSECGHYPWREPLAKDHFYSLLHQLVE